MTATEIIDSALTLPVSERNRIVNRILKSLDYTALANDNCKSRYAEMDSVMCEILGVEKIPLRCRKWEYVEARMIIAHTLRSEGFSLHQIGDAVGLDHSTIFHLCRKMEDCISLPNIYRDTIQLYDVFKAKLKLIETT